MEYQQGLVSVIIPTYKRSEKLSRAIESVLSQTYSDIELLLVNDNDPTDEFTEELKKQISEYESDPRFRLIIQEKHINGAVARNIGIRQAKGEYIAFLDDDDWWMPNKIEEQVNVLKELPQDWGGVSCKFVFYDKGEVVGRTRKYRDGYIYKDILFLLSDVATGTLCLRRNALDEAGYFDEKLLRHQDLQLLIDFTYKYKLKEVDSYLHCCDISDTQNRPNGEKLIQYKKMFFKSIRPILDKMNKSDVMCAYALHKYEVGYIFLKAGEWKKGFHYCISVFSSPKAFYYSCKKTGIKIMSMINRG